MVFTHYRYELLPFKNDVAVVLTDYAVFDKVINEVIFESDREDCEAFLQSLIPNYCCDYASW